MKYTKSKLNTVKRGRKKASYDHDVINAILDANEICNVAFNFDGKAMVQPINFGRDNGFLYLHGLAKNRMTTSLIDSGEVCLSVTNLDSMKLTRSAFHHSVNFRSVVVFGTVRELKTHEQKLIGLKAIINHFVPDRWEHCRLPNTKELNATRVIEIEITSASAKVADGPPQDKDEDLNLDYWSGIIPVSTTYGKPTPVDNLRKGIEPPEHVRDFIKNKNN